MPSAGGAIPRVAGVVVGAPGVVGVPGVVVVVDPFGDTSGEKMPPIA